VTHRIFLDANVVIAAGKPPGGPEISRVVDLVEAKLINVLTTDLTVTEVAKRHAENGPRPDLEGTDTGSRGVPWRPVTLTREQQNALHTYARRAPRVTLPPLPSLAKPISETHPTPDRKWERDCEIKPGRYTDPLKKAELLAIEPDCIRRSGHQRE
jgi:hypothetical protein